jgi:uncharacterized protein YbjT (DUF2867 family)
MILITGATGTCGREIVRQLAAAGASVRALVRSPERANEIRLSGVDIVQGDLSRPESLDAALQGVERALLVTPSQPNDWELCASFIGAAKRAGVRHIVRLSALGADRWDACRLLVSHRQCERDIEASGLAYTHLRPNMFYQNMLWYADSIRKEAMIRLPLGDAKIGHVDVRDIAAVAVKVLTGRGHQNRAYELTGPELMTYHDAARELSTLLGRKVTYVAISPEAFKQNLMRARWSEEMIDRLNELFADFRAGKAAKLTTTVRDLTGRAAIEFSRFIRDYESVFAGVPVAHCAEA